MKILVIRRDNIGDLVCTTPLLSALRQEMPAAKVYALVNSYNAPVLDGNPDVDEVIAYRKAKHRDAGESRFGVWWQTLRQVRQLRAEHIDVAIVATTGHAPAALKFARWIGAKRILAYGLDPQLLLESAGDGHETEAVMRLLRPLGIDLPPGPARVFADAALVAQLKGRVPPGDGPLIGLHVSARKPSQRWPAERFVELAHRLHRELGARFLLFWAPGPESHPQHPGDDGKAADILSACADIPVAACPTHKLAELIAGLSLCDAVICADGGAMHLAAGLGKPIVCLFGNSGAARWRPWGVPHTVLQPPSLDVRDVDAETVAKALVGVITHPLP
jgi:ADP-heptose:LPS heptosyltransferase